MSTIINLPYNFDPREYQADFLASPKKFKVAIWHRRGGKSKTAVNSQILKTQMPDFKGKTFYYILPTFSQAKKVAWDELVKMHVPMEIVQKMNGSELSVYYKNGSIQRFVGCDDYRTLKGINPIDVVFDEFQHSDPRVWTEVVKPILSENGGSATFIGTPEGKNHLWEISQFAKNNPMNWYLSIKTVDDTHGISEIEIENDRLIMPEALFLQEYFCSFTEGAGAFFKRIRENTYTADDYADPLKFYTMGIDLAKYNDWTVITPFDLCDFRVKKQSRFNQVDWNFQKMLIEAEARKYNNAQLKIDRTGVGDAVVEDLDRRGLNIGEDGAVVFTQQSKRDMLNNLSILLQQDKIKIPNDPELITELEAWQYVLSDKGKIDVRGRKNIPDDRVMSLALAVYGVSVPIKTSPISLLDDDDKSFDKFASI